MKKTNTKTKSPAPATNTAKPTKKKTSSAAIPTTTSTTISIPASAPIRAAAIVPTPLSNGAPRPVSAVVAAPVQTKIIARGDVGYGNALYVRGDGPGLSWNQGIRMECVAHDQWELTLGESSRPIAFKVLLNDSVWCSGPDAVVASGSTATILPEFP